MQLFGGPVWGFTTSATYSTHPVDASNEGVLWVFQAETADAITHIGFRYSLRTGTPPTYRVSLQGVSGATGFNDGTVKGGGTPASKTFTPHASTAWDGTVQWIALDTSYTPTRGEGLCAVIEYSSGTINGSNNSTFSYQIANGPFGDNSSFPYSAINTGGTWARAIRNVIFGIGTAASRYGYPQQSIFTTAVTTSGHRSAMAFTMNAG